MHLRQKQIRLNLHWIFMNLRSLSMSNLITELIISRIIYHWQIGFMLVFWVALSFQEFTYFKANLWSYCFFLGNSFSIAQSVRRKLSTPVFFSFLNFFFINTIVSAHWCLPPTLSAAALCDILPPAKWEVEQLLAELKPIFCRGSAGKGFCERSKDAVNYMYWINCTCFQPVSKTCWKIYPSICATAATKITP